MVTGSCCKRDLRGGSYQSEICARQPGKRGVYMTTVMMLRREALSMPRVPRERRITAETTMLLFDASFLVLRPVVVTIAVLIAAADWSAAAQPGAVGNSPPSVTGSASTSAP